MSIKKRPLAVTIVACVYVAVGVGGFVGHFDTILRHDPDAILIEATELAALLAGIFLLRAQNWARWLALAWIVFHVILSLSHARLELAVHLAFCGLIAWALYYPAARLYFRTGPTL